MRNFLLMFAVSGLFYTTLSGTLYDMTVADCNAGIEAACKEIAQVSEMIGCMLLDPDITHECAQNACVRAIEVLQLEKNLMKQFGGKNG